MKAWLAQTWFTYAMQVVCAAAMILHAEFMYLGIVFEKPWIVGMNLCLGFIPMSIFMMQFELRKITREIERRKKGH